MPQCEMVENHTDHDPVTQFPEGVIRIVDPRGDPYDFSGILLDGDSGTIWVCFDCAEKHGSLIVKDK